MSDEETILNDPEPPGRLHLHAAPELRPAEIRSVEGERLDHARAEFRAEWQAKVDRKRRQAASALGVANDLEFWTHVAAGIGIAFGALLGAVGGHIYGEFVLVVVVLWVVIGAVLGLTVGLVPMALGYGCAGLNRSRAERLEREADELERS